MIKRLFDSVTPGQPQACATTPARFLSETLAHAQTTPGQTNRHRYERVTGNGRRRVVTLGAHETLEKMMSEIRVVGLLRVREPEVGLRLLEQISGIAAGIDGVEIWEAFSNEGSDLVYLNERFASEDAYLRYESAVDAEGLRPRVGKAFEMEHLLLLSGIEDEKLRSELDALGTVTLQPVASA